MKVFLAYMLIAIVGINSCGLDQLLKFPTLVIHYQEHIKLGTADNFTQFLAMHYLGQDIDDNDAEKDLQLPFKVVDSHSFSTYIPTVYVSPQFLLVLPEITVSSIYYREMFSKQVENTLLKPPCLS